MSYIAFDLDALNVARDVGAAASLPEERITHGLLRMWAWCFREKTDTVSAIQVQGFFGPEAAPALVAFGFLAETNGSFRVRGAERYLRVTEQRSAAGRARSSSAGRSAGKFTSGQPAADQRTTSGRPALTPSTEHRAPNTEVKALAPAPRSPRDSDLLCADFLELTGSPYGWNGAKDGTALAWLVKQAPIEEVRARWRRGLAADGWLLVRNVAQLRSKWNDLAPGNTTPKGQRTMNILDAKPCARCASTGDSAGDVWGIRLCRPCHADWQADSSISSDPSEDLTEATRAWAAVSRRGAA